MATKTKKTAPKAEPKLADAEQVRATAANPDHSLAGSEHVLATADSPLKVTVIDGARATLELDDHDPLTQADLQSTVQLLNQAIQETY